MIYPFTVRIQNIETPFAQLTHGAKDTMKAKDIMRLKKQ